MRGLANLTCFPPAFRPPPHPRGLRANGDGAAFWSRQLAFRLAARTTDDLHWRGFSRALLNLQLDVLGFRTSNAPGQQLPGAIVAPTLCRNGRHPYRHRPMNGRAENFCRDPQQDTLLERAS